MMSKMQVRGPLRSLLRWHLLVEAGTEFSMYPLEIDGDASIVSVKVCWNELSI